MVCLAAVRQPTPRRAPRLAVAALLALATPGLLAAASYRLSQGLPFSDVRVEFRVSPDGRFAVYVHDAVVDGANELWSVPLAGGDPVRLSAPFSPGQFISQFEISPDSERVVFLSPQSGRVELYSAPIAGPEDSWIRLNQDLGSGGQVTDFRISPDASRVAFRADPGIVGRHRLYSVPIGGGALASLQPQIFVAASAATTQFEYSSNSERVVYLANYASGTVNYLYSVAADGSAAAAPINGALPSGGEVGPFAISPDSSRVAYVADQEVAFRYEIFSVPISGGTSVKLNNDPVPGGWVLGDLAISPDSTRVVYLASLLVPGRFELHSAPIAGGDPIRLNGELASLSVLQYLISPDGSRVLYEASEAVAGVVDLHSITLAGFDRVQLAAGLLASDFIAHLAIPLDGSHAVYVWFDSSQSRFRLTSTPLAGGAGIDLEPTPTSSVLGPPQVSPDSTRVAFLARPEVGVSEVHLWTVPLSGGERTRHDEVALAGSRVRSFALADDEGRDLVYTADQEVLDQLDLYLGDSCLLCDGFESGGFGRWE